MRRQAQGLTAIRLAEAQLAVPSGEALPTQTRHRVAPLRCRCARLNVTPELPTVSAEEPDNEGRAKVADYLRNVGIALIIERQLAGTLLDGAALCSLNCHAIIALTLRHDRLDNFWFTLLHEIGHLKRNRPVRPAYRRGLPDGYVGRQAASR